MGARVWTLPEDGQPATWIEPEAGALPPGGTTGEVLTKASDADGDADWEPGGGSLPSGWTENADGGLEISAPADLPVGALVVRLAADTDPADENSVIKIIGRRADGSAESYFDIDQGGGFFLNLLDGTAQFFLSACQNGQSAAPFRIVDSNGDATLTVAASGVVQAGVGVVFPTADPHIAGAWWDDSGTLTRSSG